MVGPHRYRAPVLEALLEHGLRPTPLTPPSLVRELLDDMYRFEIRRLRARLLRGDFPKREYSNRVVALRRRYPLLSLPLVNWTE